MGSYLLNSRLQVRVLPGAPSKALWARNLGAIKAAGCYQTVTGLGWRWFLSLRSLVTKRQPCSTAVA